MNITILTVLYCIGILVLFCLFLFGILAIRYFIQMRHQRVMDKYYKKTEQLWFNYLIEDSQFTLKLIPKTTNEIKSAENILLSYINNISDEAIQSKISFFAKAYLSNYYMKMLTHRRWSIRMNTLYRIVDFRLDNLVDYCLENQAKLKTSNEQFQVFKIQSMFRKESFIPLLTTLQTIFSETEYRQIFIEMDEEMLECLFHLFEQLPKNAQYALIEVFSNKVDFEKVHHLEGLLVNEDAEVRIRALKGMERIGVIQDLNLILPFLKSSIWEERLMVAKLLKYGTLDQVEPYLIELFNDPNNYIQKEIMTAFKKEKIVEQLNEKSAKGIVNQPTKQQFVLEGH